MTSMSNMYFHSVFSSISRRNVRFAIPIMTQLRWKKIPRRKPMHLPVAPSKLFRIPVHPYVPPDEKELIEELMDEYYCKMQSLSKLFQEELKQKELDEGTTLQKQQEDEANFRLLLEENKKENERVKAIREETLEKLFQEKELQLLQLYEEMKLEQEKTKERVEEIVRKEKEMSASYVNYDNLETAIEQAIDNPININFAITTDGNIIWEGKPPPDFEEEIRRRILESKKS